MQVSFGCVSHFFYLDGCNMSTENLRHFCFLFSRFFWRDSSQEVIEFRTQAVLYFFFFRWDPFLEEDCEFGLSLWRVLPTLLLLHPLKRTWYSTVQQTYFVLLDRRLNKTYHPLNKSIVKWCCGISVVLRHFRRRFHYSTFFLTFPKEYYTLYFPEMCCSS